VVGRKYEMERLGSKSKRRNTEDWDEHVWQNRQEWAVCAVWAVWAVLQIMEDRFSDIKANDYKKNEGMVSLVTYLVMK
jgi:hypothetical protein